MIETIVISMLVIGVWGFVYCLIKRVKNETETQKKELSNIDDKKYIKVGEKFVLDIDETKEANPFQRETIETYVQEILEIKHDYIKAVNPYHRFSLTHHYYKIDSFLRIYRHISHYKYFCQEFKGE